MSCVKKIERGVKCEDGLMKDFFKVASRIEKEEGLQGIRKLSEQRNERKASRVSLELRGKGVGARNEVKKDPHYAMIKGANTFSNE